MQKHVLALLLFAPHSVLGAITGDLAALDQVQAASELNQAALKTWEGALEIHDDRKEEKTVATLTSSVTFGYRRDTGDSVFQWLCLKSDGEKDGKHLPGYCDGWEHGTLIIDGILHNMPYYVPGPNTKRSISSGKLPLQANPVGPLEERIAAEELLWHRGLPVSKRLQNMRALSDRPDSPSQLKIVREGDIIKITKKRDDRVLDEDMVIDLAKGGSVISADVRSNLQSEHYSTELENRNGVWVPVKRHYILDVPNKKHVVRTMVWKVNRVNEPLAPERFSLDRFRLGFTELSN